MNRTGVDVTMTEPSGIAPAAGRSCLGVGASDERVPVEPAERVVLVESDFEVVYHDRYASLVRVAVLMLGDRGVAEEVVQDAFVAAYQRWDRVESPAAYLRQATVNRCRDVLRRRRLSEAFGARRDEPAIVPPHEHVDDLLCRLSARQRAAVVLRFYEDLSVDEIAEVLHARPGTVKSMLHRALVILRGEIQP